MRRLWAGTILVGLALATVPVGAEARVPDPAAFAQVSRTAFASDLVRIDGRLYIYVAGGYTAVTSVGKTFTRGFASRGRCFEFERKHFKVTICLASWKSQKIGDRAFSFDPAMRSARVSIKDPKGDTKIRWTGRDLPSPEAGPAADPQFGAFAYAHLYRDARARGKVLGRSIDFKGWDAWSFLDQGADALVIESGPTRIWKTADGRFHLRMVRRVRR